LRALAEVRRLLRRGRVRAAWRLLARAGGAKSARIEVLLLSGRALQNLHRRSEALRAARRAVGIAPEDPRAHYMLGDVLLESEDIRGATAAYRRALRLARSKNLRAASYGGLACARAMMRCFGTASEFLAEGFRCRRRSALLWCDRGFMERERDDRGEARRAFRRALAINPKQRGASVALARLAIEEGRTRRALAIAQGGLGRWPEDIDLLQAKADAQRLLGDMEGLALSARAIREISPKAAGARDAVMTEAWALSMIPSRHRDAARLLAHPPVPTLRGGQARRMARRLRTRGRRIVALQEFPRQLQRWNYCGPAVLSMVFKYWDRDVPQERIGRVVCGKGTPYYALASYARRQGFETYAVSGDADILRKLIARGIPAIIGIRNASQGHYRIAVGADLGLETWFFRDPAVLPLMELTEREMMSGWKSEGCWMLVPVPRWARRSLAGVIPERSRRLGELQCALYKRLDGGNWAEAEASAGKMLRLDGRSEPAFRAIGELRLVRRRWKRAAEHASRARRIFPAATWPVLHLAEALSKMGKERSAISLLRREAGRRPQELWYHCALGRLLAAGDALEEARREFARCVRMEPDSAEFHRELAWVLQGLRRRAPAMEEYRTALELDGRDFLSHFGLGEILERLGEPREAAASYRRALRIAPDDPWSMNHLAYLLAGRGWRLAQAEKLARRAVKITESRSPHILDTLGWVLFARGRYAAAEKPLRRALRLYPKGEEGIGEIRYHLGMALAKIGKSGPAAKELSASLKEGGWVEREARKQLKELGAG